jgi:regulator of protease activity HflC (stomatin/prohibitin superfamily)
MELFVPCFCKQFITNAETPLVKGLYRLRSLLLKLFQVLTRDSVTVSVDAVVYYRFVTQQHFSSSSVSSQKYKIMLDFIFSKV